MFDHLRDCIMGMRPEMLPMGECWGECACECHKLYESGVSAAVVAMVASK